MRDGTVRAGARPNRSSKSNKARIDRDDLARIATVAFQGDEKKGLVELSPMHWDGQRLALAKRVVVRVSLRRRDRGESTSELGRSRRRLAAKKAKGVFARLVTTEPGLYSVRYEDVVRARQSLRVDTLALRHGAESVPFRIEPPTSRFGPGSTLLFLSDTPRANPYGKETVYELARGVDSLQMLATNAAPTLEGETVYLDRIDAEKNALYQAGLVDAPDLWLWDLVMSGESKTFPFETKDLAPGDGAMRVYLQGASDLPETLDHHVNILVNGTYIVDAHFDGKAPHLVEAAVPAGVISDGANILTVHNAGDTGADYSMILLDRFRIDYPRRSLADDAHVIDITDSPRWLEGVEASPSGIRFDADPTRRYLVVPVDSVKAPTVRIPQTLAASTATARRLHRDRTGTASRCDRAAPCASALRRTASTRRRHRVDLR